MKESIGNYDGDSEVIYSKIVSKSENRIVNIKML